MLVVLYVSPDVVVAFLETQLLSSMLVVLYVSPAVVVAKKRRWCCDLPLFFIMPPQFVELPTALQVKVDLGIGRAAAKYGIDPRLLPEQLQSELRLHRRGGVLAAVTTTQDRYESDYRQLWRFLARIGDFESMLLFLFPNEVVGASTKCPAMKCESLCLYLRYKKLDNSQ